MQTADRPDANVESQPCRGLRVLGRACLKGKSAYISQPKYPIKLQPQPIENPSLKRAHQPQIISPFPFCPPVSLATQQTTKRHQLQRPKESITVESPCATTRNDTQRLIDEKLCPPTKPSYENMMFVVPCLDNHHVWFVA